VNHLRGHILAAIDTETTGVIPRFSEIIQIAIVPLDSNLEPVGSPFNMNIRPERPERADPTSLAIHGISLEELAEAPDAEKVATLLVEWSKTLKLPSHGKIVPLAHNWPFEYGFLSAWLGPKGRDDIFHWHARDAQTLALSINDRAALAGRERVFESVSLTNLCKHFSIVNSKPHDALADSIAEAAVYKALLQCEF
jgi:DNA polymerase III epsilon subunit-like protein